VDRKTFTRKEEIPIGTSARSPSLPNPGSSRQSSGRLSGVCASFQALELSFLQHAEQLGLQFEGYFSISSRKIVHLGYFEPANALCDRSGECAFLVSEQLAFPASLSEWPRS